MRNQLCATTQHHRGRGENWTTDDNEHIQRKETVLAWLCDMEGPPAQTTAGTVLGGSGIQEMTRSVKDNRGDTA